MKLFKSFLVTVLALGCFSLTVLAQSPAPAAPPATVAPVASALPAALMPLAESTKLNLGQRTTVLEFQKNKLPDLIKNMQAAAGFDVDISIDWETIFPEGRTMEDTIANWTNQYFIAQTEALAKITSTDMGKKALKAKLKKIHFTNSKNNSVKSNAYTFENGVLTYDHVSDTNVPEKGSNSLDYPDSVKAAVELLEKNL